MSLGPTSISCSHYFFLSSHYCIISYLIGCFLRFFFVSFATCSASFFLHPKWWSFSVHYMEDSHVISTIYLTDIGLEILSLRRSSRQREFVCYLSTWECVYLLLMIWDSFVHVQGTRICIYVKKNSACVYVHSVLDHWVCILMFGGHFYRVCSLLGVRMWALWDPMLFVLLCHIYLWERWVTFS